MTIKRLIFRLGFGGLALLILLLAGIVAYTSSTRQFEAVVISANGYLLGGYLSIGKHSKSPWVVFVHGNRKAGNAHKLYEWIRNNLSESISVLAIDMRGFGKSSAKGLRSATHILDRGEDIEAAAIWLNKMYGIDKKQLILIGHSLGALQVIKAAIRAPYLDVISIGPGQFEKFVRVPKERTAYMAKFQRNTGVRLDEPILIQEGRELMLPILLTPCPSSPVTIIYGSKERDGLHMQQDRIPHECKSLITWRSIPLADHMYGTEGRRLWKPLREIYSKICLLFLKRQLNQLILSHV